MRLDNPQQTTFVLEYGHTVTYRAEDPTVSTSRVRLLDSTFSFFPGTTGGSTITGGKNTNESLVAIPTSANPPGTATYDVLMNTQDTTALRVVQRLRNLTTGTPAAGIGTSVAFTLNNAGTPAVETIFGVWDLISTAMTLGAEATDWRLRALVAGTLLDVFRVLSTGGIRIPKAAGAPATPPAGYGTLYFDTSTGKPAAIDSSANVYDLAGPVLTHYTGTTTAAFVQVFSVTNANGVHGSFCVRNNDGINGLKARLTLTDFLGNTNNQTTTVAGLSTDYWLSEGKTDSSIGWPVPIYPPFQTVKLEVEDATGGSHASWDVYSSFVG